MTSVSVTMLWSAPTCFPTSLTILAKNLEVIELYVFQAVLFCQCLIKLIGVLFFIGGGEGTGLPGHVVHHAVHFDAILWKGRWRIEQ